MPNLCRECPFVVGPHVKPTRAVRCGCHKGWRPGAQQRLRVTRANATCSPLFCRPIWFCLNHVCSIQPVERKLCWRGRAVYVCDSSRHLQHNWNRCGQSFAAEPATLSAVGQSKAGEFRFPGSPPPTLSNCPKPTLFYIFSNYGSHSAQLLPRFLNMLLSNLETGATSERGRSNDPCTRT